jgi:hypothetical protein
LANFGRSRSDSCLSLMRQEEPFVEHRAVTLLPSPGTNITEFVLATATIQLLDSWSLRYGE